MKKLISYVDYMNQMLEGLKHDLPVEIEAEYKYNYDGNPSYVIFKGDSAAYVWYFNEVEQIRIIPNGYPATMLNEDFMDLNQEVLTLGKVLKSSMFAQYMANAVDEWLASDASKCDCEQWSSDDADADWATFYPCLLGEHIGATICHTCKDDAEQMFASVVHQLVKEYNKLPSKYELVQALRKLYDTDTFVLDNMFHYMIGLVEESTYGNTL